METIIVLTDFSPTAKSALLYACTLAEQVKSHTIVLYHSYDTAVPFSEAAVVVADERSLSESALHRLKHMEAEIRESIPAGLVFRHRADEVGLNNINRIVQEEGADLIIMGTSNKTKLEEIFLGSNAVTICKLSNYPVVLVPLHIEIQPVKQVMFACDMKEVEKTIPVRKLKMVLDLFKMPLTVLNVDDEDKHFTADTPLNTMALHNMLDGYNPAYYNINSDDITNGIVEFARNKPGTIVLLISKRHNFMEGLFYRSVTRQLAYKTFFPLLIINENDPLF